MRDQDPGSPRPRLRNGRAERSAAVVRGRFGEHRAARGGYPSPAGNRFSEADDVGPVDLVEVQADDELINALSSGLGVSRPGYRGYDVDDRLAALLTSWKDGVERKPFPQLVAPDDAVAMLQPARPSRKTSFLRPLAAAAAVAACALSVVSIGAYDAQPQDALWGVTKMLYSERAGHVQAASDLRQGIERVNAKLAAGDTIGAQQDLAALGPTIAMTDPQERAQFEQQSRFLTQKAAETPPGTPVDPRAPLRDGTPAPLPTPEGGEDQGSPARPATTDPTTPAGDGTPRPESSRPGGGSSDQGSSSGSGGDPTTPTSVTPSPSQQPSPTTEGTPDRTTSARPTPTASGHPGRPGAPSSTGRGALSSTPN